MSPNSSFSLPFKGVAINKSQTAFPVSRLQIADATSPSIKSFKSETFDAFSKTLLSLEKLLVCALVLIILNTYRNNNIVVY